MELHDLLRILQSIFGIGLVVFVHELGHYLAARMCGVRVETFSLGFGPRLLGWRRGATMYQIALVPLGGFCRMAGEEHRLDGLPPEEDELPAKSVEKRFFIYSAGVLMNVAFVLVTFPILFKIGVPFTVPRIGDVRPGSPAWHAGIKPGSDVLSVNGNEVFEFAQIHTEVALGGAPLAHLVVRDPDTDEEVAFALEPEKDEVIGLPMIGVEPAMERDDEGRAVLDIEPNGPAWRAGLRTGDRLDAVLGGLEGLEPREQLNLVFRSSAPARLRVVSDEGVREIEVVPEVRATGQHRIGISPPRNHVLAVRDSALVDRVDLREDDRLLAVAGRAILRLGDLRSALRDAPDPVELRLRRGDAEVVLSAALTADERRALVADVALAVDVEGSYIVVEPDEAGADAGLRDSDRVLSVDGTDVARWEDVFELVRTSSEEERTTVFHVERLDPAGGPPAYPAIAVQPREIQAPSYGLFLRRAQYTYRAETTLDAIRFGFYSSWKLLDELWLTLKGLVTAEVPAKSLGGIIAIGQISYSLAEAGWPKFFFFLCFLSMNLAVLNVLPIPVLDGGHLFFLIIEKIKGSPVSERVLGYSQMVGVVLILSLMVFVTYNDLIRFLSSP
jgi:regulator of sigma E protease